MGIPDASGSSLIEQTEYFTPHKIMKHLTTQTFVGVPQNLKDIGKYMYSEGWRFYVVDQSRGRCYYGAKTITIPAWLFRLPTHHRAFTDQLGYKIWYLAHELSHAYTASDNHGPLFMARLIDTCPPEYTHYELGYKPRAAKAAGITVPSSINLGF